MERGVAGVFGPATRSAADRVRTALGLFLALAAMAAPGSVSAQVEAEAEIRGEVRVGDGSPLRDVNVVLHRVSPQFSGELDSIPSAPDGSFRLALPRVPDPQGTSEIYFASARYDGVLYFGIPITTMADLDSLYVIQVYDSIAAPVEGAPVGPRLRYILAEEVEAGWQITDLMQLDIAGDRTWVAADSGVTWSYPLPSGIRDVQVGGGDIPPDAVTMEGSEMRVTAPLPPGPRQVVARYYVDSLALSIPVPGGVEEMDFLVRQPGPAVQVQGLIPAEVVEMDGVSYQRFAASNMAETTLVVSAAEETQGLSPRWIAVGMGFLMAVLGVVFGMRRGPASARGGGTPTPVEPSPRPGQNPGADGAGPDEREMLIVEVAQLDLTLESAAPGPERDRIAARRGELLARLHALG